MSNSHKVFIYNGNGASQESVEDLVTLLSTKTIFPDGVDISRSDFNSQSFYGLSHPTFVVPGGSAITIAAYIADPLTEIESIFSYQFNYIGICAGAFIGTTNADIFDISKQPASFALTTRDAGFENGILDTFKAVGPFAPCAENPRPSLFFTPYRVTLSIGSQQQSQLYIDGPGFIPTRPTSSSEEVLATYNNQPAYTFHYPREIKSCPKLAAIVRKLPDNHHGSVLLSGVHIEANVPDSQLFHFFSHNRNPKYGALTETDQATLKSEQAENIKVVESIFHETLRRR
jgi:glutamine amidotransferase-like uncharacterized protein